MNIGEFDRRIELYHAERVPDGMGGWEDEEPKLQARVWAKFLRPKFWEGLAADGPASSITQGITIRTRTVDLDWTVRYKGQEYRILHIDYSKKETITLTCQVVIHNG